MLAVFKGEISIYEMLHAVPYKTLLLIRDARIKRLREEQELMAKEAKERAEQDKRNSIRNQIMMK